MFGVYVGAKQRAVYPYAYPQLAGQYFADIARELEGILATMIHTSVADLPWTLFFAKTPPHKVAAGGKVQELEFWELWAAEKNGEGIGLCFRCRDKDSGYPVTPNGMNIVDQWNHQAWKAKISDQERVKLLERMHANNDRIREQQRQEERERFKEEALIEVTAGVDNPTYRQFARDAGINPVVSVPAEVTVTPLDFVTTYPVKRGRGRPKKDSEPKDE